MVLIAKIVIVVVFAVLAKGIHFTMVLRFNTLVPTIFSRYEELLFVAFAATVAFIVTALTAPAIIEFIRLWAG